MDTDIHIHLEPIRKRNICEEESASLEKKTKSFQSKTFFNLNYSTLSFTADIHKVSDKSNICLICHHEFQYWGNLYTLFKQAEKLKSCEIKY